MMKHLATQESFPAARFERFEVVVIANERMGASFAGRRGTIIWCDYPNGKTKGGGWMPWIYVVSFADPVGFRSFAETDLRATGAFDAEGPHLGVRHEISYDTVPSDDMVHVEGAYRLPGRFWHTFGFGHGDVEMVRHELATNDRGITNLAVDVPRGVRIDHRFIVDALSEVHRATSWALVSGPDSMILRS